MLQQFVQLSLITDVIHGLLTLFQVQLEVLLQLALKLRIVSHFAEALIHKLFHVIALLIRHKIFKTWLVLVKVTCQIYCYRQVLKVILSYSWGQKAFKHSLKPFNYTGDLTSQPFFFIFMLCWSITRLIIIVITSVKHFEVKVWSEKLCFWCKTEIYHDLTQSIRHRHDNLSKN